MAKNLIIYYSRTGEDYVNGKIIDLKKGLLIMRHRQIS